MKRLFLGFAPNADHIAHLAQLQQNYCQHTQGVALANLHLTLAFYGMLDARQQMQLIDAVDKLSKPQFCVTLAQLSFWPKPKILCISGQASDPGLIAMAKNCANIGTALGGPASDRAYTPHITLSRKAHQYPHAANLPLIINSPIVMAPDELHLYHSHNPGCGVQYDIIKSWPLSKAQSMLVNFR